VLIKHTLIVRSTFLMCIIGLMSALSGVVYAEDAIIAEVVKRPLNLTAIAVFFGFVLVTL